MSDAKELYMVLDAVQRLESTVAYYEGQIARTRRLLADEEHSLQSAKERLAKVLAELHELQAKKGGAR